MSATKEIVEYVFGEAAKSNIAKRKVGAVIVNAKGEIIATGHNNKLLHAEVVAINAMGKRKGVKLYTSHPPCPECATAIAKAGLAVEVVQPFMKFDGDKVRYDLVPPKALKYVAEVLTYGARKYKPGNWRSVREEELFRYVGAMMRHTEAYRSGEWLDPETGLPHLAAVAVNAMFLLELDPMGALDNDD